MQAVFYLSVRDQALPGLCYRPRRLWSALLWAQPRPLTQRRRSSPAFALQPPRTPRRGLRMPRPSEAHQKETHCPISAATQKARYRRAAVFTAEEHPLGRPRRPSHLPPPTRPFPPAAAATAAEGGRRRPVRAAGGHVCGGAGAGGRERLRRRRRQHGGGAGRAGPPAGPSQAGSRGRRHRHRRHRHRHRPAGAPGAAAGWRRRRRSPLGREELRLRGEGGGGAAGPVPGRRAQR